MVEILTAVKSCSSLSLTSVVGFSALLDQVRRVFNELSEWLDDESVDVGHVFD